MRQSLGDEYYKLIEIINFCDKFNECLYLFVTDVSMVNFLKIILSFMENENYPMQYDIYIAHLLNNIEEIEKINMNSYNEVLNILSIHYNISNEKLDNYEYIKTKIHDYIYAIFHKIQENIYNYLNITYDYVRCNMAWLNSQTLVCLLTNFYSKKPKVAYKIVHTNAEITYLNFIYNSLYYFIVYKNPTTETIDKILFSVLFYTKGNTVYGLIKNKYDDVYTTVIKRHKRKLMDNVSDFINANNKFLQKKRL